MARTKQDGAVFPLHHFVLGACVLPYHYLVPFLLLFYSDLLSYCCFIYITLSCYTVHWGGAKWTDCAEMESLNEVVTLGEEAKWTGCSYPDWLWWDKEHRWIVVGQRV